MKEPKKMLSVRAILLCILAILGTFLLVLSIFSISGLQKTRTSAQQLSQKNIRNLIDFDEISYANQKIPKLLYEMWDMSDSELEEAKETIEVAKEDTLYYLDEAKGNDNNVHSDIFSQVETDINKAFTNADTMLAAIEKNDRDTFDEVMRDNQEIINRIDDDVFSLIGDNDAEIKDITNSQISIFNSTIILAVTLIIFTAIIICSSVIVVHMFIAKPLRRLEAHINKMADDLEHNKCDLSIRIPVKHDNEIGRVAISTNKFLDSFEKIIIKLVDNTKELDTVVENVMNKVTKTNDSSTDISAVSEELAASMENVTDAVNEINSNMSDVNSGISDMESTAGQMCEYSQEMKKRASGMEKSAHETKDKTQAIITEIVKKLDVAINDSKNIEQINNLTNDILSISDQTNLLSLNASIEAARAGEAGQKYNEDASTLGNIMEDFANKNQHLSSIVGEIATRIDSISANVNESNKGIMNVAGNISTLVCDIDEIHSEMDKNEAIAKSLKEEADCFITE